LVLSSDHAAYLTRHRIDAIVMRIRLVSAAFSGLTLLWIVLDAVTLPWPTWGILATLRLVAAVVFIGLAVQPLKPKTLGGALGLLAAMLVNPLAFYLAAQFLFVGAVTDPLALVNARLYEALPFVIMAGLGVFPLVMIEGVLFAAPVLLLACFGPMVAGHGDWVTQITTLWILVLMLGIYLLAGMIQMHYMMALLRRASHDPLTGAFSRRSGMELMELQFRMARERDAPFALAFVDVDNFKSVNDGFGHDVGDKVLRAVAEALGQSLRRGDSVVRWGGEEFVVLLLDANLEGLRIAMTRVVTDWLGARPDGAPVTASIGVAERILDGCDDWPDLVDKADHRMYEAKMSGKAHVILPGGERIHPPAERSAEKAPAGVE
jgi:diguanylate cyclase (GGDEF)-like protein